MAVVFRQEVRTTNSLLTTTELDAIGTDDWNLVGIIQQDQSVVYVFSKTS
jgi:hypothetical protein